MQLLHINVHLAVKELNNNKEIMQMFTSIYHSSTQHAMCVHPFTKNFLCNSKIPPIHTPFLKELFNVLSFASKLAHTNFYDFVFEQLIGTNSLLLKRQMPL